MTIGDRVRSLREQKGMTQEELSVKLGYKSKSSVTHIEKGRDIPRSMVVKLADILGTTPAYLMGWEDKIESNLDTVLPQEKIRMIPLFESVSAGFGAFADSSIIGYEPIYIESDYDAANSIAIKVKGNSMYPKIEDGDTIVVIKELAYQSGDIVAVMIEDEGFVKRIRLASDKLTLESINPEYPDKVFVEDEMNIVNIVGVVKKIIKNL